MKFEEIPSSVPSFETPADRADKTYSEEILPLLEILKPDNVPFDMYEEEIMTELLDDAQRIQEAQNRVVTNPEQVMRETKDLLHARIAALLEDSTIDKKNEFDPHVIAKAKIALLKEGDLTDIKKYLGSSGSLEHRDIRFFKNYLLGYGADTQLSESELEALLKTPYRESIVNSQEYDFFPLNENVCTEFPESLLIALAQSDNRDKDTIIRKALEQASEEKYDTTTLEHILPTTLGRKILPYVKKFQGAPLENILSSGVIDADNAIKYLVAQGLPQEDLEKYVDLVIKNNDALDVRGTWGKYSNNEYKTIPLPVIDTLEAFNTIEFSKEDNHEENLEKIKHHIHNGDISLISKSSAVGSYLKEYVETDYEGFKHDIIANNQEHLALEWLREEDKQDYAQKLVDTEQAYKLVAYIESFPALSLDRDIFIGLKEQGFLPDLNGNLSRFNNLTPEDAVMFIQDNKTATVLDNFESFALSPEFLQSSEVQQATLIEFNKALRSLRPEDAKKIEEKIGFPAETVESAAIKAVYEKWLEKGRNDWARNVIKQFPEIKPQLDTPENHEKVVADLEHEFEHGYAQHVADMVECFPLPSSILLSENVINGTTALLTKELQQQKFDDTNFHANVQRSFADIEKISSYIPISYYFLEMKEVAEQATQAPINDREMIKPIIQKIIQSQEPQATYDHAIALLQELEANKNISYDMNIALLYLSQFEKSGTPEEKQEFFENIRTDIASVSRNEPAGFSDKKEYYEYIVKEVYPERNYNSYKRLNEYEDRTADLDSLVFNREGYAMRLSGVLGYKVREGAVSDTALIDEFSQRIDTIKDISDMDRLSQFIENTLEESHATTIEGKILEYFKQHGYTVDTMNVLLAYQLRGQYDTFVSGSADRASAEENTESKNYILLDELVNQYGDTMKETIKAIQEKVATSVDRELFSGSYIDKYQKRYGEVIEGLVEHFNKIPRDKITNDLIQKKVLKTIKNTFQGVESVQDRAEYFSTLFGVNDLDAFQDTWNKHVNELFVVAAENSIDTSKVQSLQASVYTKLQNEISKYEEIKEVDTSKKNGDADIKLSKERIIKGYFSKNKENAHARMVGDICLASDPSMLKNEKYLDFVLFDEDREKCVGTTMLLQMDEPEDGKKYLLYCPNPSVGLVSEVSAKKLYHMITDRIIQFSKENNFDGVLLNKTHGNATNRSGLFQQTLEQSCLKNTAGEEISINLKNSHQLSGNYKYQKDLQAVWLR